MICEREQKYHYFRSSRPTVREGGSSALGIFNRAIKSIESTVGEDLEVDIEYVGNTPAGRGRAVVVTPVDKSIRSIRLNGYNGHDGVEEVARGDGWVQYHVNGTNYSEIFVKLRPNGNGDSHLRN